MSEELILLENVTKCFPGQVKPALNGLNIAFPKGKIIGLVGPDGAGKTTLMRLLAGLLLPTKGKVTLHTKQIGYMPQKFGLYEDLTVMQNLTLYADLRGVSKEERAFAFEKLLSFTGLTPFTKRLAGALSGGMKQKLGLACTLIQKPQLLLLDEPSVGVDPLSRRELWKMIEALLSEEISVVWSTVYLDEAKRCEAIVILSEGKIAFSGEPKDLKDQIDLLGGSGEMGSKLAQSVHPLEKSQEAVIVAKELTKKFGSFTAADQISFEVKQGEIFGLLGPNGAGKSTTFKMLCGLLKPTSGQALVRGVDLQKAPDVARGQIGYMAQKFSLYGNLTVLQNLHFFASVYNLKGKEKQTVIDQMVDIFALKPFINTSSELLPLGFKQRLSLACATMHHPKVLFLDEPTSGVDPLMRREFWNHMNGLSQKGVTIMVTTHFMDEAEHCDRIALIYGGKIISLDTPDGLKKKALSKECPNPTLDDAFIAMIQKVEADAKR